MRNERYEEARERVEGFVAKWEPFFDLPGVSVHHAFIEDYMQGEEDSHWTCADTESDWHYRDARVRWYLPSVTRLSDDDLEHVIVHEYVHILMGCIEKRFVKDSDQLVEHATENIARALLQTHHLSQED